MNKLKTKKILKEFYLKMDHYYLMDENDGMLHEERIDMFVDNKLIETKVNPDYESCYNCDKVAVCFVYKQIYDTIKGFPINIDSDDRPGNMEGVFKSMANCCLKYNFNNDN